MKEKEERIVIEHFLPYLEISLIFYLFIFIVVKNEKKNCNFVSGCHKHIVQLFIMKILMCSFEKCL